MIGSVFDRPVSLFIKSLRYNCFELGAHSKELRDLSFQGLTAKIPPSITISCPFVYAPATEARYSAVPAISCMLSKTDQLVFDSWLDDGLPSSSTCWQRLSSFGYGIGQLCGYYLGYSHFRGEGALNNKPNNYYGRNRWDTPENAPGAIAFTLIGSPFSAISVESNFVRWEAAALLLLYANYQRGASTYLLSTVD